MSLRWRLALLIIFATGVPVLTGVLVTRQLVDEVLEVGLSPQLDAALEAGVNQARAGFQAEREALHRVAEQVAASWPRNSDLGTRERREALTAGLERLLAAGDGAILATPDGQRLLLRETQGPEFAEPPATGEPPRTITAGVDLEEGWRLEIQRTMPAAWREDAGLIAETLQVVRGLRLHQTQLVRMYWLPFLAIFLLALAVGLALALRLGQGITEPVRRLVLGTEDVAAGRWDVQVPVAHHDELGQLTDGFNTMVRTLELQSRRLVDLETMAGWREMARALAHEVKNPLTPIQLTVEEIRARYPGGDDQYEELLNECTRIVVEEVESLRAVVARFREFSRPVELIREPTDLVQLVRDVATMQRDLKVEIEAPESMALVAADPDRLRQVLMNLAANAREATREIDEARLGLAVLDDGERVILTVEDNGPGIAPDERERVFEPYRSGRAGGLGLGLALVKGIILAHDGDITVDRGRWNGARFTVTLPRRPAETTEHLHA